ncbi:MAG TPA: type I methionyl aminopeptidase [Flavobacteriaceae bacterium]|nr:type I methionyl aminopeptidase [Flavobacteriaceae bacterium]
MFSRHSQLVIIKNKEWFDKQKYAGKCVGTILRDCKEMIEQKTPNLSLKDLEAHALDVMKKMDCTPTFKDYKGGGPVPFPNAICTSVNENLVHGVVTDYVLQEGDVVSVDLGATYDGVIADAAYTAIYGEPKSAEIPRMLEICRGSLYAGIKAAKVGNRIGAIGNAIHKFTKNSGFSLISKYGGHGIDLDVPHASPFIANQAETDEGIHILPGLTIAIEPMLVMGDKKTSVLDDGWTVKASGVSCHFEHSIFIEEDNIHIMTEMP